MKKRLSICFFTVVVCFMLGGCGKTKISKSETILNSVFDEVGEYFGNKDLDHSNLGAYYMDTEKNIVIVVLVDNTKEKQDDFLKNAKIEDFQYIEFVQGGPYSAFK